LHMIAISRWRIDPTTKAYVARKKTEGHSNPEILRLLKRYIAPQVYYLLRNQQRTVNQGTLAA
ncbi:MAG: IS110 family transposase, partial [Fimbriimonadaceae bacterium]|nr:IS110 family transposase [Fimbriimonadaceae bacterium]